MVQDVNDDRNFVVIGHKDDEFQVVGHEQTDVAARKLAEAEAHKAHDWTYAVYQRIGSVKVTPQAEWKGAR